VEPHDTAQPAALDSNRTFHDSNQTGAFAPTGGSTQVGDPLPGEKLIAAASIAVPGYEVLGVLGRGGMGIVYKARQIKADRLVALKLMLHAEHAGTDARARFDNEARAVARMQHPNIVQVFEVGEANGLPFFSLEFVAGGTLSQMIKQSLLPASEIAVLLATLARAMSYAHRNSVIHRDLKPGNILLTPEGTPKIADFGLARKTEADTHVTQVGAVVGTPSYMAPEQAGGNPDAISPAVDVYALGAILYELLTGRAPFLGQTILEVLEQVRSNEPLAPSALQPHVPRDLETICLKCLQKDAAKRYVSADELADDLERYRRREPIKARPIGPLARAVRWCRRNPAPAAVVALSLLAALIAGGAAFMIAGQKSKIATQNKDIIDQNEKITAQKNDLAAKEKIATARLEVNRRLVSAFAQDAPAVADNHPLAEDLKSDVLQLVIRLLIESQDQADVGTLTQRGLLTLETREGDLARMNKKLAEAEAHYQKAFRMAEEVVQKETIEKDKAQSNLAFAYIKQGELAQDRKKHAEAVDWYEKALAIRQQLVNRPETGELNPVDCKLDLGRMHVKLADAYFADKRYALAMPEAQAGSALIDKCSKSITDKRRAEMANQDLGRAFILIGNLAFRSGNPDLGHKSFKEAIDIFEQQLKINPESFTTRFNLSRVYSEYGDWLYMRADQPKEALTYFEKAQKQNRLLCGSQGVVNIEQTGMALGYYRLGVAAEKVGKLADAKTYYGRCLELRELRLRELQEEFSFLSTNRKVIDAKIDRMLAQARCQRGDDVLKMARFLLKHAADVKPMDEKNPELVTDANELKAHCELFAGIGYALVSWTLTPSDPRRDEYVNKAIDYVRQAVEHGFDNLWFLENDADLDSIRLLPDYKKNVLEPVRAKKKTGP